MPLTLDGGRNVTGTIDVKSVGLGSPLAAGAGALTVSVDLEALVNGRRRSDRLRQRAGAPDPDPDRLSGLVHHPSRRRRRPGRSQRARSAGHVSGPVVASGFIANSGKSFVDVPSFSASFARSVLVSLDDPSFTNAIPARLSGNGWSLRRPDAGCRQARALRPGEPGLRHRRRRAVRAFTVTR